MSDEKGRRFEYRVRRELVKRGWFVTSPKSNSEGPADLIALKRDFSVLLIQCKSSGCSISEAERKALLCLEEETGGIGIVAGRDTRQGKRGIRIRMLWHAGDLTDLNFEWFGPVVFEHVDPYRFNVAQCAARMPSEPEEEAKP